MRYFKIMTDDQFIGVVNSDDFRTYYKRNKFLGLGNEENGEYIDFDGTLYRDTWMKAPTSDMFSFVPAAVQEIEENVYDALKVIPVEEVTEYPELLGVKEPEEKEENIDPLDSMTIEYARAYKIQELSNICNKLIEDGIDFNGSHYSLTTQDQLNLLNAQMLLLSGALSIPYHADNEPYRDYGVTEITAIINAANEHKVIILQKFNTLKQYILTLDSLEEVIAITWDTEVPN